MEGLPVEDAFADYLICQEGIEHFSDQLASFKEFNRVLKKGGGLIVTTPNYSSLRAKMSYFLSESERFNSIIAPNELDSIWMSNEDITNENFADGKKKGKSRPGRVKRAGASCKGSVTSLRAKAKKASGERAKMYHWCANMKSGRKKKK